VRTVKLSYANWLKIYNEIAKNHPHSVLLVRTKMRQVLGFTSRTHSLQIEQIHLDFFDERKYTMFILKYSEYL
jgi:ribosomal protein L25 (general stress protein Ctc)